MGPGFEPLRVYSRYRKMTVRHLPVFLLTTVGPQSLRPTYENWNGQSYTGIKIHWVNRTFSAIKFCPNRDNPFSKTVFLKKVLWKFGRNKQTTYLCTRKQELRVLPKALERGVEQLVARKAHNLEVVRSSRASATNKRQMWSTIAVMRLYSIAFSRRLKKMVRRKSDEV